MALKPDQIDDLRAFKNEVEHNPFNTELFGAVLTSFSGKVDRPMGPEDFVNLKRAVVYYRKVLALPHVRIRLHACKERECLSLYMPPQPMWPASNNAQ